MPCRSHDEPFLIVSTDVEVDSGHIAHILPSCIPLAQTADGHS